MKTTILVKSLMGLLLTGIFSVGTGIAQTSSKTTSGIEWKQTTYDFGKIPQGKPVNAEFQFKNPSMIPLMIYSVNPSCGCTVADYPKEPVQPQKTGIIKVTFNASSTGFFQKSVAVATNAGEGNETLIIKGEVISN
jgi:hypothetical protein